MIESIEQQRGVSRIVENPQTKLGLGGLSKRDAQRFDKTPINIRAQFDTAMDELEAMLLTDLVI